MIYLVYTIHVIVCIFLILVVLLQQGKGADLSVFGGGSTQTAFGARGATTLLHKLTVASFVLFIVTTMSIAVMQGGGRSTSVMGEVMEQRAEEAASTTPEELDVEAPAEPGAPAVEPEAPQAPVPVEGADQPGPAEAPDPGAGGEPQQQ